MTTTTLENDPSTSAYPLRRDEACGDECATSKVVEAELADAGSSEPGESAEVRELSMFGLVELMLKNEHLVDRFARSRDAQRELIPRLLAIGLSAYAVFGATLATFFATAHVWPRLTATATWLSGRGGQLIYFARTPQDGLLTHWLDGSALAIVAAFAVGLIGAIGVCLPSFYFYGLLAGVRTTILHVTTLALKGMAASAIALMGGLPIYFAFVLALVVFDAPHALVAMVCYVGLALPFIAGLWGTRSLYLGFVGLCDTMKPEFRLRRACFLRRLLFSWSACFTAVTPVMIFTLWEFMSR
ncbi:MAG: hypothetical protein WD875_06270 [Pirellulales bacterium]